MSNGQADALPVRGGILTPLSYTRVVKQEDHEIEEGKHPFPRIGRVVLDTSLFVNPEVRKYFGDTPTEALEGFLFLAAQIPILEFYMPPSIFKELLHFVNIREIPGDLLVILHQKPPSKYEMSCPAFLLYELIEDIRTRINKGLRVAESAVRTVSKKSESSVIQELRRKYREALREGIIDSKEDVDLILLAKELDALLVTADQGVIKWAEKMGIKWLFPEKFKDYLLSSIKKAQQISHRSPAP